MSVWDLPRNDLAKALEFYRAERAKGPVPDAVIRVLARLQDDPSNLFQAIRFVNAQRADGN